MAFTAKYVCAQANAVVRELARLFKAFAREEAVRASQQAAPDQAGARQVVDPSALREALHALNPKAFSIGSLQQNPVHACMHAP
jgi:hypothetical protein